MDREMNMANTENKAFSDNINEIQKVSDDGEKLFTRSQVEALITERIKRERKVNEALMPVKQLMKDIASRDEFKGKSYSEISKKLVEVLSKKESYEKESDGVCMGISEENKGISDTEKVNDENLSRETSENTDAGCVAVQSCGNDESLREKVHGTDNGENEENAFSEKSEEVQKEKNVDTVLGIDSLCAFKKKYPTADMNKLFDSNLFGSFAKGRNQSLMEICEDFCSFLSLLDTEKVKDDDESDMGYDGANRNSSMLSTAFSSHSATSDISGGLTKQQMEIAKSAGLSYREYSQLLSSIPKSHRRTVTD